MAELTIPVLVLIDTSNTANGQGQETRINTSYCNYAEALLLIQHLKSLIGE